MAIIAHSIARSAARSSALARPLSRAYRQVRSRRSHANRARARRAAHQANGARNMLGVLTSNSRGRYDAAEPARDALILISRSARPMNDPLWGANATRRATEALRPASACRAAPGA